MIIPCARAGLLALALSLPPASAGAAAPGRAELDSSLPARAPQPQPAVPLALLALLITLAGTAPLIGDRFALRRRPAPVREPGTVGAEDGVTGPADAPLSVTVLPEAALATSGMDALLRARLRSLRSHAQDDDLQRRLLIAEAHLDFGHTVTAACLLDRIEHDCCAAPPLTGAARQA